MKGWRWGLMAMVASAVAFAAPEFLRDVKVPPELSTAGSPLLEARDWRETLELPNLEWRALAHDFWKAMLPGARPLLVPQMPEVPFLYKRIPLPEGMTGRAVLVNLQVEETTGPVAMKQVPPELVWSPNHQLRFHARPRTRFFPGRFYTSQEEGGEIHLTLFPVQVDRETGRVLRLKSAEIFVAEEAKPIEFQVPRMWDSPSVILVPEKLKEGAELLEKFHESALGIKTDVVTVESIDKSEPLISEDELPDGYKTRSVADEIVVPYDARSGRGYRYDLARKIIHFMQARMSDGSSTRYVTLLGDADAIPPSYYFSSGGEIGATDECYAARAKCLDPRLSLGRLPFSSVDDVRNYIAKAARWIGQSKAASSELALYAGKAFPTDLYVGELGVLNAINSPKDNWRGVKKFFRSHGAYNKQLVLDMLHGKGNSSFVYYLDHGGGNLWSVDEASIGSNEVLAAADSGSGMNPFVASIACSNAAFDERLLKGDIFSGAEYGLVSIGEAMLKSKAGAVAYLGALREALGQPVYDFDVHGNLNLTGTTYDLQLLDHWFSNYESARKGRLGDALLKSQHAYIYEDGNDFKDDDTKYAFYNLELLGDPVLPLPKRSEVAPNYGLATSTTELEKAASSDSLPRFLLVAGKALTLTFQAPSEVLASLFREGSDTTQPEQQRLAEGVYSGQGQIPVTFPTTAEGNYFLRLENRAGVPVERQVWFEADKPGMAMTPSRTRDARWSVQEF